MSGRFMKIRQFYKNLKMDMVEFNFFKKGDVNRKTLISLN